MSEAQRQLLELLAHINQLEQRCKHLKAPVAVPPSFYEILDKLAVEVYRWGMDNIAKTEGQDG